MLLGIIVRELWPRRRELLLAALLLLIWRAIVSFMVESPAVGYRNTVAT
ncbi:hypothetical protein [Bradyrhizobium sp. Ghvi]|nr:hypothetical protein [Bradyrhizobium sp. Ghvi]